MNTLLRSALLIATCAAAAGSVPAQAQPEAPRAEQRPNQCFQTTEFRSWRAPDPSTIYVRVRVSDVYELKLTGSCPFITSGDAFLVTKFRGSSSVCDANDWDLKVAQNGPGSIPVPCIVRSMRRLSPQEAAAIPKKARP
jgi:hypothetical protein